MKRLIPSPPLSGTLLIVWVLLHQSLHATTLLSGAILAIVVPLLTRSLRPATVRMRRPVVALRLAGDAIVDMLVSALNVARLVLTRRNARLNGYFVQIPLELRDPNGLAVLAMIMCLTPGTAWGELSFDRSTLLIHVFDLVDEEEFVARLKQRYERPLLEIFQ
ncbi:Na+/H+ antiporter subunit E [Pseudorhodoferax sp. Leaf267]|uniref:Na+/H+ antiporter subunit E n=1 Tax=Pseudorhodoferax sp. Leaf267 TaxID=1736316 RepID=UPI0006F839EE|nr:Na+/H+ antiporter subunit E [Pseudorhodoferax sp. Leaf267]KQP14974.1 cation:proton antiporter [Pseudorhodoferax sp. Leaf267]